ncbi:uncharacterized protein [Zea mays]|jgi:hypothetical protein|uniref:Uncharacterized protein n=1 Tax=Zea mays TaxID=4577 RepID=A0A1D6DVF5_MAIZE|nr:uncharacterized protein LOC100274909 [Zea mays]ONM12712.1 hypothetical protein ZEAMMB73_Zm00001d001990 [Zea mays]|eukprot:XP_008668759.1 uncharacterized protein LOC100274909 [Zea mays]
MRRRWSRAAVLACLLLLACVAESRAVPDASGGGGGPGEQRRGAFDVVVVGLVSIGLGRRWRAGEMVDEDKRRVPTGPNPLHNR